MTDKTLKGLGNQIAGNAKEVTGKITGNKSLEAEGVAQENLGDAQREAARVEHDAEETARAAGDKAKGIGNQIAGNVKEVAGKITGNERLQAEGVAQELKGKAQSKIADVRKP